MSSAILYLALASSGWRLDIAPFVLYLTSFAFTAGILWQLLCGRRQKELLEGFLALPLGNRELASAWEAALGAYVLLTRTVYVWALFLAAASWTGFELFWALVCGLAACIAAPEAFRLWKRRRLSWPADAYDFYREGGRKNTKKRGAGRSRVRRYQSASVFRYLFRYLMDNQSYCVNTLGLGAMAVFLPLLAGQLLGPSFLPICFAILCLNTPLGTLLSGDPELLQAVRVLPGQERALGKGYCKFLFCGQQLPVRGLPVQLAALTGRRGAFRCLDGGACLPAERRMLRGPGMEMAHSGLEDRERAVAPSPEIPGSGAFAPSDGCRRGVAGISVALVRSAGSRVRRACFFPSGRLTNNFPADIMNPDLKI